MALAPSGFQNTISCHALHLVSIKSPPEKPDLPAQIVGMVRFLVNLS